MATASSSPLACIEKQRLLDEYARAVSDFNRMNSAQVAALRNSEGFIFTDQIAAAGLRMDRAKYAILAHEQEHGC